MRKDKLKIVLKSNIAYLTVVFLLMCSSVFAQKIDTTVISYKPKARVVSKVPLIKGSVQPYKMNIPGYLPANSASSKEKPRKNLTILKVYPNPVIEQLNISLRLEKETNLSIKITDLLGNEIVTLANEKTPQGEHTKTYSIPAKLNSGIYFLRILAGGEPIIKKISVL